MNCPLCDLVKRVTLWSSIKKPWKSKVKGLNIKGWHYIYDKKLEPGIKDVVLYLDKNFLFVRSVRNKRLNREFIVCMPIKHIEKKDFRSKKNSEMLRLLDERIIKFIESNFSNQGEDVRVVENFGHLASVPGHMHKQIVYTQSRGLYLRYKPVKYK